MTKVHEPSANAVPAAPPKVSVIIPVYNSGKFLEPTVESVLSQTFRDFELLLVDDGSTDGSGKTCDDLAARDARIRVFHRANCGICATRNFSMTQARGHYLAFCDHDDFCEPEWLDCMIREVLKTGCPIVKCDHSTELRSARGERSMLRKGMSSRAEMRGEIFRPRELVSERNWNALNILTTSIWDCLFERSFVERHGLVFDESFRTGGEDMMFMRHAAAVVDCIAWCPKVLYRHYENIGTSTSVSYHENIPADFLRIAETECRLFPATGSVAYWRFKRWMTRVWKYAYGLAGCRAGLREKCSMVGRYYDVVVRAAAPSAKRRLGARDAIADWMLNHRMYGAYVLARDGGLLT